MPIRKSLLAGFATLFALVGCAPQAPLFGLRGEKPSLSQAAIGNGDVRVSLRTTPGLATQAMLADVDHIDLSLQTRIAKTLVPIDAATLVAGTASTSFKAQPPGAAILSAEAFDTAGRAIGQATKSVQIQAAQILEVGMSLTLSNTPGGNLNANVAILEGSYTLPPAGLDLSLDPLFGSNPTSLALIADAGVLPLYPDNGAFSVGLTDVDQAVSVVTNVNTQGIAAFTLNWEAGLSTAAFKRSPAQAIATADRHEVLLRDRLRKLPNRPLPEDLAHPFATEPPLTVGATRSFTMYNFTTQGTASIQAKNVFVHDPDLGRAGAFAIWVDERDASIFEGAGSKLQAIADELRLKILPTNTQLFGAETTRGDNAGQSEGYQIAATDDYVNFVFSRAVSNGASPTDAGDTNVLGYFDPQDILFGDGDSNKTKALFIASNVTAGPLADLYAVVAHELQHLQFGCHRVKAVGRDHALNEARSGADAWINEGMAMLAMLENGYGPDQSPTVMGHVQHFLDNSYYFGLVGFFGRANGGSNLSDAYGMATLFTRYLADRAGLAAIREIHALDNRATMYSSTIPAYYAVRGLDLVERVLASRGMTMGQLFADFATALYLDGRPELASLPPLQRQRFSISGIDLQGRYELADIGTVQLSGPHVYLGSGSDFVFPFGVSYCRPFAAGPSGLRIFNQDGLGLQSKLILSRTAIAP